MYGQLGNILYFLLLAGMFVFMMRYGCGAHIMGHGHDHGGTPANDRDNKNPHWIAPNRAVDPVCGMTVQPATAKSAVHDGRVYYFCSQDCRQKFEAAPASYVKPVAA
jgi:YHS domain-containing protein